MFNGNKKRLYIALYPASTNTFEEHHWALTLSPKLETTDDEESILLHIDYTPTDSIFSYNPTWTFEQRKCPSLRARRVLARICVGKVKAADEKTLVRICTDEPLLQKDPAFTCRVWVKRVLQRLGQEGIIEPVDVDAVERTCEGFLMRNEAAGSPRGSITVPTWSMQKAREVPQFFVVSGANKEGLGMFGYVGSDGNFPKSRKPVASRWPDAKKID